MKDQFRKSPRAFFYEYEEGCYFITMCTRNMIHFLGEIHECEMHLSRIGKYLDSQLQRASELFPEVEVPLYVVMPNHVHMIIYVNARRDSDSCNDRTRIVSDTRNPNPVQRPCSTCQRHVPTLSRYINSLKGSVTKFARSQNYKCFGWQSRFHDHVIKDYQDGNKIAEYILNNVARWDNDCFYQ